MTFTKTNPVNDVPPIDAATLERFRQTGLRLDASGQFWHEGAMVTHQGIRMALLRWMDTLADGRSILRIDDGRYAYIEVDDAHLLATSANWRDDRVWLVLNDGTQEELAYETLVAKPTGAMYCRVRGGRLRARLKPDASATVAEQIWEQGGNVFLHAAGQTFAVSA